MGHDPYNHHGKFMYPSRVHISRLWLPFRFRFATLNRFL